MAVAVAVAVAAAVAVAVPVAVPVAVAVLVAGRGCGPIFKTNEKTFSNVQKNAKKLKVRNRVFAYTKKNWISNYKK